ncbi:hypothetical protein BGZ61DRAFT_506748 [Ilyonectria robusta]|uniref:uncharacterized protein n=1 Tax=Ilyonectria robusta TaxID=1079257 RepID=UPI001E8CC271|nr:uncharacterized protein BGZ61DRAFT_506748 [Ilyonectria robusta]KAH8688557.1 hypothetical protein BGZ61DRAFT_506748 [Ilyonectria robusta]
MTNFDDQIKKALGICREDYKKAWRCLYIQFSDERAILMYRYSTYIHIRARYASCFMRNVEASDNNAKSYFLNGMSYLYRVDKMLTARKQSIGCGSEYLGELPEIASQKAVFLKRITGEHRKALKGILTPEHPSDIHLRWYLGEPVSEGVYRRILDPKIANNLPSMVVGASSQTQSRQPKRRDRSPRS